MTFGTSSQIGINVASLSAFVCMSFIFSFLLYTFFFYAFFFPSYLTMPGDAKDIIPLLYFEAMVADNWIGSFSQVI